MATVNENSDIWYPTNNVFAVLDTREMANKTADELRAAGFPRDEVKVFYSDEAVERIDATGNQSGGPIKQVARSIWSYLFEEGNFMLEYQGEAQAGRQILAVHTEDEEKVSQAGEIIKQNGGKLVRYFGPTRVESLWL